MTSIRLDNKVALVTGSSRGIGRAIAQRLASAGATVVVTGRSLETSADRPGTLKETMALIQNAGGRAIALSCDIDVPTDCENLVARATAAAGSIDILVNNAGTYDYATVEAMSVEAFDRTFIHYLRAPFIFTKAVIPQMKAQGQGWIVNIGSVTAQSPLRPFIPHDIHSGGNVYAAIKAALNRFTQGVAAELLEANIAVNVVSPSTAIATPGAVQHIPEGYPCEDVAYIAETVLHMCHLPAAERTGLLAYSMHFPAAHRLDVFDLDGITPLPPAVIPAWSHPGISPTGE